MKIIPYDKKYKDEVINLLDRVYKEYGDEVWLEGYDADLLNVDDAYRKKGGAFWIAISDDGEVFGTVALKLVPEDDDSIELKRMYIDQSVRGTGLAHRLTDTVIEWGKEHGYKKVVLWTDTQFTRAHRFYEKYGFTYTGRKRDMDDFYHPYSEYEFVMEIGKK